MDPAPFHAWLERIKSIFRRDPRRAWLVTGVSMVMVALSTRLLAISISNAPAAVTPVATHVSNSTARNLAASAERAIPREELVEWLNAERRSPRRDLFASNTSSNPALPNTTGIDSQTEEKSGEEGGLWDEVAKSLSARADHRWERQQRCADLKREAGRLRLTKIVPGPPPAALVNDELFEEGSVVASFRVLKIEPRRIIV